MSLWIRLCNHTYIHTYISAFPRCIVTDSSCIAHRTKRWCTRLFPGACPMARTSRAHVSFEVRWTGWDETKHARGSPPNASAGRKNFVPFALAKGRSRFAER